MGWRWIRYPVLYLIDMVDGFEFELNWVWSLRNDKVIEHWKRIGLLNEFRMEYYSKQTRPVTDPFPFIFDFIMISHYETVIGNNT